MKKAQLTAIVLVVVASLAAGCGPTPTATQTAEPTQVPEPTSTTVPTEAPETEEPPSDDRYGGTLHLSTTRRIGAIDPTLTQATYLMRFANNIYASLVRYVSGTWEIIPDLVSEMPTVSDDGLVYTFHLRPDLKFHDGTPLTAEDVVFSLQRAAGETSVWQGRYEGVEEITALDEQTVQITLRQLDPYFLYRIAGSSSAILPQHVVEQSGDDFATTVENTIGSGPYMLVEKSETELVLERNPYFYEPPFLDRVVVRIIPDATTEALEFDAGNIDWMASILSPDIEERYAADPAYEGSLKRGLSTAAFWLALNPAMEPFDDIRVRQAVASILERESIVEAGGQGVPGYTLIHPTLPGHDPTFNPYPIDVDAAQLLLEEAGYADGVSFEIHVWNIPGFIAMAEVMQQQLLDAGLDVELRVVDFGTMMAEASEGTYAAFFNLGNIFVPDPAEFLYGLFYSESALNVNYLNEDVDRLLEEAIAEPDIAARGELVAEADRLIVEDAVAIPYQFRVTATLFQPWVHGHEDHNQTEASGQTTLRWSDLWLDPEYRE